MAEQYFPFDSGAGANVTEDQWRLMARHWLGTGVLAGELNLLEVYGDSSGMQVKVKSDRAWIRGHYYDSDAEQTVSISTADATNPRIDRVVLQADFTNKVIDVVVLTGTAAATTAAPALTQSTVKWEISLAQVRVGAAVSTIAATVVSDERTYAGMPVAALAQDLARTNQLTNGGLDIWQRGAGAFTANNAYTADRWQISLAGTDALSVTRSTTKKTNSQYSAACAFTLGSGAGATKLRQRLYIADKYHHLLGQSVSLMVSIRGTVAAGARLAITTDGTGGTTTYSNYKSQTDAFEELMIPALTVPTDATYVEIAVVFSASGTWYVDNAMLVLGTSPASFTAMSPADELTRCQRYFEVLGGDIAVSYVLAGFASTTTLAYAVWLFRVEKYGTPTIAVSGVGHFQVAYAATAASSSNATSSTPSKDGVLMSNTVAAVLTVGHGVIINTQSTGYITAESNPS